MSHKLPGPPIGPFSACYVDPKSTSDIEDGSQAHPFRTIQAALNAMPVPTDAAEASITWYITVASGFYEEDLTFPVSGAIEIRCPGAAILGSTAYAPRNMVWNPITGAFGQDNRIRLFGLFVIGNFTVTSGIGVQMDLYMEFCMVAGSTLVNGDTNVQFAAKDAEFADLTVTGKIETLDNCKSSGTVQTYNCHLIRDSSFDALVVTGNLAFIYDCEFDNTVTPQNCTNIERCKFNNDVDP